MAEVNMKTVDKAFRGELEKMKFPSKEISAIITKLAELHKAGISIDDLSIVVHNLAKPDFKQEFTKMNTAKLVQSIRSDALKR